MVQFYLLSILSNVVAGLVLAGEYLETKISGLKGIGEFFKTRPSARVTIGVVTFLAGFLKLLTVTKGDVPVVGDLIPALAGLVLGGSVLFDRYKEMSTVSSPAVESADKLLLKNRAVIGTAGLVVALVHFLIPGVLFL